MHLDDLTGLTFNALAAEWLSQGNDLADIRRIIAAMKSTMPEEAGGDSFQITTCAAQWAERAAGRLHMDDGATPDTSAYRADVVRRLAANGADVRKWALLHKDW